jgi:hypothetical protein
MTTVASGGLLPGVQQYLNNSGQPLSGGSLVWYIPGTQTLAAVWTDAGQTIPAQNPTPLDAGGVPQSGGVECQLYGTGAYSLQIRDSSGAVIRTLALTVGGSQSSVATISALRALTAAPAAGLVFVQGYNTQADGGEGWFQLVPSDTTSPDNSGTIIVDSAGDRWYRAGFRAFSKFSVLWFGAYWDNVHDDTTAVQATISAIGALGPGGIVGLPAGKGRVTSTLTLGNPGITVEGAGQFATRVNFGPGSYTWWSCVGGSYAAQLNGPYIREMSWHGNGPTGGQAALFKFCYNGMVEKVDVTNCWAGIQSESCNNVTCRDVTIAGVIGGLTNWALYFNAPSDGSDNNIELDLDRVIVNTLYSGADGIRWDGYATTLNAYNTTMLQVRYGLSVLNSAESTQFYPQYGEFVDFTVDGASLGAVFVAGGSSFKFTGCNLQNTSGEAGQGSADVYAVAIEADSGFSYTRELMFSNCFIGLALQGAVNTAGQNVLFSQCRFGAASTAPANTYDAITVAAGAADTLVNDCIFSYFGSPNNWRYGINIAAGTFRTVSTGCSFNIGCRTGAYLNSSNDSNTFVNNFLGPPSLQSGPIVQSPEYSAAPANPGGTQEYFDTTLQTKRYWNPSTAAWANYP